MLHFVIVLWHLSLLTLGVGEVVPPSFDYLGSNVGDRVIRLKCRAEIIQDQIKCEGVRVLVKKGMYDIGDLNKFFSKVEEEDLEHLKKRVLNPETLEREKKRACEEDPLRLFADRGAYNENYQEFIDELNRIRDSLCAAPGSQEFISAWEKRQNLKKNLCRLDYEKISQVFTKEKDRDLWKTSYTDLCATRGIRSIERDPEAKGKWRVSEDVESETNPLFHRCYERVGLAKSAVYSENFDRKKPSHCSFLLDRERNSECCAFDSGAH